MHCPLSIVHCIYGIVSIVFFFHCINISAQNIIFQEVSKLRSALLGKDNNRFNDLAMMTGKRSILQNN